MMLTLPVQFVLRRMAQSIEFGGSSVIVVMYVLLFIVVAYYYCLLLLFIVLLLCRLMGWRVWCLPVWVLCPSRSAGWLEPPWTSWRECQCVCCVCVCVCVHCTISLSWPLFPHPPTPPHPTHPSFFSSLCFVWHRSLRTDLQMHGALPAAEGWSDTTYSFEIEGSDEPPAWMASHQVRTHACMHTLTHTLCYITLPKPYFHCC